MNASLTEKVIFFFLKATHSSLTLSGPSHVTCNLFCSGKWHVDSLMQDYETWKKLISACKATWNFKKVLPNSPYENILKKNYI